MIQPGDILAWKVTPTAGWVDRLIGWGEHIAGQGTTDGYQYYHVAFVSANPNKMYSSQPGGIDLYMIPDPFPENIEVYRIKGAIDPEGLQKVFSYATSRCGRPYPYIGVLSFGWLQGNLEFCSQYTEDAFAHYPILLCPDIRFSTPDDIVNSQFIYRVN